MNSRSLIAKLGAFLSLLLLVSCASQPSQFYTLGHQRQLPPQTGLKVTTKTVGVGPVTIPKVIDRPQIITRGVNQQVDLAEFHQWAEPLRNNINQVMTDALAEQRTDLAFYAYPWSSLGAVDQRISVNITRFDGALDGDVILRADWSFYAGKGQPVKRGKVHLKETTTGPSYDALVAAQSRLLSEMSTLLARELP